MRSITASTWDQRKAVGDAHEDRVQDELQRHGWEVALYGQRILPEPIRNALKRTESRMRWDPDMVASQGTTIALIDAKSSMRGEDAWTYSISRKALSAHARMSAELDLPIYYVFSNLGVSTPAEVMRINRLSTLGAAGGYVPFPSGRAWPFEEVFGSVLSLPIAKAA